MFMLVQRQWCSIAFPTFKDAVLAADRDFPAASAEGFKIVEVVATVKSKTVKDWEFIEPRYEQLYKLIKEG